MGIKAEKIVFKYLTDHPESFIDIKWDSENADLTINPNGKAGLGYDIKYTKDGITYFAEVKGSKHSGNQLILFFSRKEIEFARRHLETYQILLVNGTENTSPKIQCIENIFVDSSFIFEIKKSTFSARPNTYEVLVEIE